MKLKIKENAGTIFIKNHYTGTSPQYCAPKTIRGFGDKITAIQGMTVEVETRYLWDNQFNTVPTEGVSKNGLRILNFGEGESIIEEIIDDERPSRLKCPECFNYLREDDKEDELCWWCGK